MKPRTITVAFEITYYDGPIVYKYMSGTVVCGYKPTYTIKYIYAWRWHAADY